MRAIALFTDRKGGDLSDFVTGSAGRESRRRNAAKHRRISVFALRLSPCLPSSCPTANRPRAGLRLCLFMCARRHSADIKRSSATYAQASCSAVRCGKLQNANLPLYRRSGHSTSVAGSWGVLSEPRKPLERLEKMEKKYVKYADADVCAHAHNPAEFAEIFWMRLCSIISKPFSECFIILRRLYIAAGLGWTCSKVIDGCLVQISCSSNFPLMLDTLRCRLGSRDYNCKPDIHHNIDM